MLSCFLLKEPSFSKTSLKHELKSENRIVKVFLAKLIIHYHRLLSETRNSGLVSQDLVSESEGSRFKLHQALGLVTRLLVTFVFNMIKHGDRNWMSETVTSIMAQIWPWGSQTEDKRNIHVRDQ